LFSNFVLLIDGWHV
jgi:phospholipid-transporting ATPase